MKKISLALLAVLLTLSGHAQVNLNLGLIANFPFSGNANDATGNGHNAVLNGGAALTTDRFGNAASAFSFDGVDDYLRVPDDGAFSTGSFSIAFWFTTDRNNIIQVPVGKRDFGPTNNSEFGLNLMNAGSGSHLQTFLVSSTKPCADFGAPNEYFAQDATTAVYCTNRWYHVVITFSNGVQRVYLDGQLENSATAPFTNRSGCSTDLRFGMWWSGDPNWFRGKLDEIRWYNRALNSAEALALYVSPTAPPVQPNCAVCTTLPQAGLSGSSLCSPASNGSLNFVATAGTAPFTVTISDGSASFTQIISSNNATIPVTVAGTTSFTLLSIKDANGCERGSGFTNASATVTVNPLPTAAVAPAAPSVCAADSTQLTATGGGSYTWSPSTGLSATNVSNPKASPASTTTYTVTVTGPGGCSTTTTVTVTVRPKPVVTLSAPTSICAGDSTQLSATGGGTYAWTPATGLSNPSSASPKASPATTTTYQAVVTGANGCRDSAMVTVGINNRPVINLSAGTSICAGDSVQLTATGGGVYLWTPSAGLNNNSIAAPKASPSITTVYQVLVTNAAGCKDSAVTTINVTAKPFVNLGPDTLLCGTASLTLNATVTGATQYSWSTGSSTPTINVTNAGVYSVAVTAGGCLNPARDTIAVQHLDAPTVDLGPDRSICSTDNLQLSFTATNASSFVWSNGSTGLTLPVTTPGTYGVTVQNACGSEQDAIVVDVKLCDDEIYFPSGFTPNDDGKNDQFKALHAPNLIVAYYRLYVYNRWGNLLFSTTNLNGAWDGKIKGKPQGINTFVYYAEWRRFPGSKLIARKGTVILMR